MWDCTPVPCVGRWIINHWTKREVPVPGLKWKSFLLWDVQIGGELAPLGWAWLALLHISFILLGPVGPPGHVLLRAVGKAQKPGRYSQTSWGWDAEWGHSPFVPWTHQICVPLRTLALLSALEHCPQTPMFHMSQLRNSFLDGPSPPPSLEQALFLGHCCL